MLQGLATLKLFGRSREQVENIRRISRSYGNTTMEVLQTAFQTGVGAGVWRHRGDGAGGG